MSQEGLIFVYTASHTWLNRLFALSIYFLLIQWAQYLNKAPFPSALQRQPTRNNFKLDISLRFNFVDKENNIKVTQINIILSCSLGGF